jgi:imidazolonepropionase-like amidohydrolase
MSNGSGAGVSSAAPSSLLVVKAGTLVDGTGAAPRRGVQIYVRDGRIVDVGPSGDVPSDAQVLDYSDRAVVPGLIDCHVHLAFSAGADPLADLLVEDDQTLLLHAVHNAQTALVAGITTVRDLGDRNGVARVLRDGIARDIVAGPRIVTAGAPITITGGHCHFLGMEADSEDDVRRVARQQIRAGVNCLKIMASGGRMTPGTNPKLPQYSVAQVRAAVEEARRAGLTIAAHALSADSIRVAAEAAVDTVEHCNWLARPGSDGLAFDESTAVLMRENGVAFDPTLTPVQGYVDADPATLSETQRAAAAIRMELLRVFRRMLELGVTMVAGTDAGTRRGPLDNLPGEIALYVEQLGLSPVAAISSATGVAAKQIGLGEEIGTVQAGRYADLTVVDGDPSVEIRALGRARAVLKGGRLVAEDGRLLR